MSIGFIILGALILIFAGYIIYAARSYQKKLKNFDFKDHSKNLVLLNDNTFAHKITGKIALVDFWAEWCQPCKIQAPIVSELADDYAENKKVVICSLNVEQNQKIAAKYQIRNIPTIIIFKNGKEVQRIVGLKPKSFLKKQLERFIQ